MMGGYSGGCKFCGHRLLWISSHRDQHGRMIEAGTFCRSCYKRDL